MRLKMHLLLAALLTGVLCQSALAEEQRGDCPPPPGAQPQADEGPEGDAPGDHHGHHARGHFRVHVALAEFDLNKDGRIAREEIDRALRARFDEADANHNGTLDPDEFAHMKPPMPFGGPPPGGHMRGHWACGPHPREAARQQGPDGPPPPPPFDPHAAFNHFDWNLDGKLTFEEFAGPIRQMAMHLDRNGDGVIDEEEMKGPVMMFGPGFGPPPGSPPEPPRDR
jgi:hypothetical protein